MIFFPCDSMISRWVGYTCLWQDDKFRLDVVHGIIFVTNWIIFMIFYYNILYESIGSTRINNLNNDCTKVESIRFFLKVIEWKKDSPACIIQYIYFCRERKMPICSWRLCRVRGKLFSNPQFSKLFILFFSDFLMQKIILVH
jgi:hypothetical protein